ncbi:MAG TPA: flippase [Patescibacteria group bacterium]|nr:flippase [Patescibacteria group bacterium]
MSLRRNIAKNAAVQMAGKIIGVVLSIITAALVTRHLGTNGFGQYTKILSFLQFFGIAMDFGLYIILIKKIADIPNDKLDTPIVHTIFTLRVISGIFFLSLAPIVAWMIGLFHEGYSGTIVAGVALTTGFFFFISLNQLLSAIFQKVLRSDWIALAEFVGKIVLLVSTLIVIFLNLNVLWVLSTLVLSSAVNFLINFLATKKYVRLRLSLHWDLMKRVIYDAWPTALSIAFGLIYFKGDTIILSFYESDAVIGRYGAPYKILEVLVVFPAIFAGLVMPVITAAWQQKHLGRFRDLLQKSFDALSFIAIPLIAGVMILAPYIIEVIAGSDFQSSTTILRILIIATAAIFFGTLFGYIVVSLDQQRLMMWGYGFVAITAFIGYLIVIPRYSVIGAAWLTVYSEVLAVCISYWLIVKRTHMHLQFGRLLKAIFASLGMYIVLRCVLFLFEFIEQKYQLLSFFWYAFFVLIVCVPLGALVYVLLLFALRALRPGEVRELISLKK